MEADTSKHPKIYGDDNIDLYIETHPYFGLFAHCIVHNWSKSSLVAFRELWDEVLDSLSEKGFPAIHAAILEGDSKLQHFSSLFGFEPTGRRVKDSKGDVREVYRCES